MKYGKECYSEPVYNDKYIKATINLYNANFYDNKTPIGGKHILAIHLLNPCHY